MSTLKIGIMSFAHVHAAMYLSKLVGRSDVELMTCDPDGESATDPGPRGARYAAEFGAQYVDTYDELFAWGPDAVVICTENARHIDAARLAAAARTHILCEKPLATTVADAEEMVTLAEEAGVQLMTAFPIRFYPAFEELRKRVGAGAIGDVLEVLGTNNGQIPIAQRRWFVDPELGGGGALVDHVVHCSDLLDMLLGEAPSTVRAVSNSILHADQGVRVATAGLVTLHYPSGVVATIDCSWSQPTNAAEWGNVGLEVTGSHGAISFQGMARSIHGTDADGDVWLPIGFDVDHAMVEHFLDSVRHGKRPAPDGRAGLRATQIVCAALESAKTGQPVSLLPSSQRA